jgi:hypothetical protein
MCLDGFGPDKPLSKFIRTGQAVVQVHLDTIPVQVQKFKSIQLFMDSGLYSRL